MTEQEPTIEEARQAEVLTLWRCPVHGLIEPRKAGWSDWPDEDDGDVCPLIMADENCCMEPLKPLPVIPLEPLREWAEDRFQTAKDNRNPGGLAAYADLITYLAHLDPKDTP